MLVLTRKTNEEVVINGNIRVRVLGVNGSRIRLGIDAPAEVAVLRSELEDCPRHSRHHAADPVPVEELILAAG